MKGTLCQLSYSGKIQNRDIRLYALHPLSVLRLIVPVSLGATVLAHYFKGITPCFAVGALAEQSCSVKVIDGIRTRSPKDHNLVLYRLSYDHKAADWIRTSIIFFTKEVHHHSATTASTKVLSHKPCHGSITISSYFSKEAVGFEPTESY